MLRDWGRIREQCIRTGVDSFPLVALVGFFAGSIIAWQAAYQFKGLISLSIMGGQATRVIVMEMGPVLTALVISGRIGASMAAELGTMRLSEQIDALLTLAISPIRFLALPRIVALTIMMPLLTFYANMIAIVGACFVSNYFLGITPETFFSSIQDFVEVKDIFGGIFKAVIFGALISGVSCHIGLKASGGSVGVGNATIQAFVGSAVAVLISDYILWIILF
ncbi:MAG: ABC transporter permease [Bacteroidia bacterium]|nr:ABC transporter permease [Bacteroidia bacterium]